MLHQLCTSRHGLLAGLATRQVKGQRGEPRRASWQVQRAEKQAQVVGAAQVHEGPPGLQGPVDLVLRGVVEAVGEVGEVVAHQAPAHGHHHLLALGGGGVDDVLLLGEDGARGQQSQAQQAQPAAGGHLGERRRAGAAAFAQVLRHFRSGRVRDRSFHHHRTESKCCHGFQGKEKEKGWEGGSPLPPAVSYQKSRSSNVYRGRKGCRLI